MKKLSDEAENRFYKVKHMADDNDDVKGKKIKRNSRCITRKRRHVISGAVRNKTVCLICRTLSGAHEYTVQLLRNFA